MDGFGIDQNTKSTNSVNYDKGGCDKKAALTGVKMEEVGKDIKYTVLSFTFLDHEGIKTFKHSEFLLDSTDPDYNKKLMGMNSRIKHIYEAYKPLTVGIGVGAASFKEYLEKIAEAFNTGNEGGLPIYKTDKGQSILTWLKLAYYSKKGNIGFPLSPNFIERITQANQAGPKTLTINKQYDNVDQPEKRQAAGNTYGGGGIHTGQGATDEGAF